MSANDPRVRLAGVLRAHLADRVSALLQASRDARVHAGFMDPASFHAWRQHSTPEQVAAAYYDLARGMGGGAGKTTLGQVRFRVMVAEASMAAEASGAAHLPASRWLNGLVPPP